MSVLKEHHPTATVLYYFYSLVDTYQKTFSFAAHSRWFLILLNSWIQIVRAHFPWSKLFIRSHQFSTVTSTRLFTTEGIPGFIKSAYGISHLNIQLCFLWGLIGKRWAVSNETPILFLHKPERTKARWLFLAGPCISLATSLKTTSCIWVIKTWMLWAILCCYLCWNIRLL